MTSKSRVFRKIKDASKVQDNKVKLSNMQTMPFRKGLKGFKVLGKKDTIWVDKLEEGQDAFCRYKDITQDVIVQLPAGIYKLENGYKIGVTKAGIISDIVAPQTAEEPIDEVDVDADREYKPKVVTRNKIGNEKSKDGKKVRKGIGWDKKVVQPYGIDKPVTKIERKEVGTKSKSRKVSLERQEAEKDLLEKLNVTLHEMKDKASVKMEMARAIVEEFEKEWSKKTK